MRTTNLVTISLPPGLVVEIQKIIKSQHMTRSELFRDALRQYIEEQQAKEAIRIFEKEKRAGKLRILKGSLADLMR